MPESDSFHEMYASKEINMIRNRTVLVRVMNLSNDIIEGLCIISPIYIESDPDVNKQNQRNLFFAGK